MNYSMQLLVQPAQYQAIYTLYQQAQSNLAPDFSERVGAVFADLGCDLIEQLFSGIHQHLQQQQSYSTAHTIEQIKQRMQKYLPWSLKYLSDQRLMLLLDYFLQQMQPHAQGYQLSYAVPEALVKQYQQQLLHIRVGDARFIASGFASLNQILDLAVTQWVRQPKELLKLNVLMNRSMDGVIHVTTQIGYQRLKQLGEELEPTAALQYLQHFLEFLQEKP